MSASEEYLRFLADIKLDDDGKSNEARDLGTLMFAAVNTVLFVLTEDVWPVFVAWYRMTYESAGATIMDAHQAEAIAELTDMASLMAGIASAVEG